MKFCTQHWDALRQAIQDVGLSTLVAEDGREAMAKMVGSLNDGVSIDNFDPLMQAHNTIMSNALHLCNQNGGEQSTLELMGVLSGVDWCPLCYLNAQHKLACEEGENCTFSYDRWVEYAAKDQLSTWQGLKA